MNAVVTDAAVDALAARWYDATYTGHTYADALALPEPLPLVTIYRRRARQILESAAPHMTAGGTPVADDTSHMHAPDVATIHIPTHLLAPLRAWLQTRGYHLSPVPGFDGVPAYGTGRN